MKRTEVLDKILKSYESYYDIKMPEATEGLLTAECTFHVHSEKYVLMKKAQLWSADSHEHVYVFSISNLTKELYEQCRDIAYEKGMGLIDPKPGHMYTYITALFICDECTKDALRALRHCHIHKNFQFSLLGWMDFHTALVDVNQEKIYTNGSGRDNAKFLKRIFHVTKTKKGR